MLKAEQKISVMDVLFSILEFAASYNSYTNLRLRMHHIAAERLDETHYLDLLAFGYNLIIKPHELSVITSLPNRPPLNLLRQELAGTCIYLDVLQKTTAGSTLSQGVDETSPKNDATFVDHSKEEKLQGTAEEKLVSFCGQVLREASDFQSSLGETTNMDIHRVLELRSPIIVKV